MTIALYRSLLEQPSMSGRGTTVPRPDRYQENGRMEEVFATTERAALPKRVVNSDFAYDELLGRRFRQPLSPPLRTSDFLAHPCEYEDVRIAADEN
jgi:hypothetical protein